MVQPFAVPRPVGPTRQERQEQFIEDFCSRFELKALVKALKRLGYGTEEISFEGVQRLHSERGPLIGGVRFETRPSKRVVVQLNTGLLEAGSPLPAYFSDFGRRLAAPEAFLKFMGFWDAVHLRDLAQSAFVDLEENSGLQRAQLARLNRSSTMFLHWCFSAMFPELGCKVTHRIFEREHGSGKARVGAQLNGRMVLGAQYRQRVAGFRVMLHAESEASEGIRDWEAEAMRRVELLDVHLRRCTRPVQVMIHFKEYSHGHALVSPENAFRQLGVRPWLMPQRQQKIGPAQVLIREPW